MQIILGILYILVGILLAIPYCLLAGWKAENILMVTFVAPAFLFIWFILAGFAGIIDSDHTRKIYFNWRAAFSKNDQRRLPGALFCFWTWALYSFLPIIFHWSAILLEKIGHNTVSLILNTHRYAIPLYTLTAIITLIILNETIRCTWNVAKSMWVQIIHR